MDRRTQRTSNQLLKLKIIQLNAQRSKTVAAEISQQSSKGVDIILLQEPYIKCRNKNKLAAYCDLSDKIMIPPVENPMVGIIIKNRSIQALDINCEGSGHLQAAQLSLPGLSFYVINAYFQHSDSFETRTELLNSIEALLIKIGTNEKVLICADFNAKSTFWHSPITDTHGENIEIFINQHDLAVLNRPGFPPTFSTIYGSSYIDASISTQNFTALIHNWKVIDNLTMSDHNTISFEIWSDKSRTPLSEFPCSRYNLKTANWDIFECGLNTYFEPHSLAKLQQDPPNRAADILNVKINQTCEMAINKQKLFNRKVPWWSEELTLLRRQVNQQSKGIRNAKRRYGPCQLVDRMIVELKKIRNKYTRLIKKSKAKCWQDFVTSEGNRDPWGLPYKIIRNKISNDCVYHSVDGVTKLNELGNKMLAKMVPRSQDHAPPGDYTNDNMEPPIMESEIKNSILRMRKKTAPGIDGIYPEILAKIFELKPEILINIFNNCLENRSFPNAWKVAELKILLKRGDRDPNNLGSYRPISLLPSVGKLFERILLGRIQTDYYNMKLENSNQMGFKRGLSTDDALLRITSQIRSNQNLPQKTHTIGLFLDVKGAFDNVSWSAIFRRLSAAKVSGTLYDTMRSYFTNRRMILKLGDTHSEAIMQRGCPQGSIVGPLAWNWVMDELLDTLSELETDGIHPTAYADDLALIIHGKSRDDLQNKANKAIEVIQNWCQNSGLQLAEEKSIGILFFHTLKFPNRIIIKINDKNIQFKKETKYLGIWLDEDLTFIPHFKKVKANINALSNSIKTIARHKWGLNQRTVALYWKSLYLPIATYGAVVIDKNPTRVLLNNAMDAIDRAILLGSIRACRTVSTAALRVLAGAAPLRLEIKKLAVKYKIRKNISATLGQYEFIQHESIEDYRVEREYLKLDREIGRLWQEEWESGDTGRLTKRFFPQVKYGNMPKWYNPDMFTLFLLSGYGSINGTLHARGAIDTPSPNCPECPDIEETVEHILFECPLYTDFRYPELEDINFRYNFPKLIGTSDLFAKLKIFAGLVFPYRRITIQLRNPTLEPIEIAEIE